MTIPITFCQIRKALDSGNWKRIDEAMKVNRVFGAFSLLGCKGHLFKKECVITKEEEKEVKKHLSFRGGKNKR